MIRSVAFRTQARTVDHLGREQIADCPTAISELWKNAYDAYARNVELHVFDGKQPVAAIYDDGHGMNAAEFIERWLVVGTHSKIGDKKPAAKDRNGLPVRPKQGQKGIGRLSSANLGPLLLLVSKRKEDDFVAALIDWRIFENPYLILEDIRVPVTEFKERTKLFAELPDLFELLMENIWGGKDEERKARIELAWSTYDKAHNKLDRDTPSPSKAIAETVIGAAFSERHIRNWPVWNDKAEHGTVLLISDINFDLRVLLDEAMLDDSADRTKDRFFETLSSFVDPFVGPTNPEINAKNPDFRYEVKAWSGSNHRTIVGTSRQFDRDATKNMEHILAGFIDEHGVFHGRVKAFGDWRKGGTDYVIDPPKNLKLPERYDTKVGPVDIYIATFERVFGSSTHTEHEFSQYTEIAQKYAGLMIFRDGLRVMPYGREDNDFFEIETRRSLNAGREFWNKRRMFGRIAISRDKNPNLKDKAGREGFIDNTAAKAFRVLVENILKQSARDYFGSSAELRKEVLPEIKDQNRRKKAEQQRDSLREQMRKQIRSEVRSKKNLVPTLRSEIRDYLETHSIERPAEYKQAEEFLEDVSYRFMDLGLPELPPNMPSLENDYRLYQRELAATRNEIDKLSETLNYSVEQIKAGNPEELLREKLKISSKRINSRVDVWSNTIQTLQRDEYGRLRELAKRQTSSFEAEVEPIIERVSQQRMSLSEARKLIETVRIRADNENEEIFTSYISALEALSQSIDLEALAIYGTQEIDQLHAEVDRLNSLAQLGITVEILGHELQSYESMIGSGINGLPEEVRGSSEVEEIQIGYQGLMEHLRFLSPLKLAGNRDQRSIHGEEIYEYCKDFFRILFVKNGISFEATEEFRSIRLLESPSRIFPVFINLINNSVYWMVSGDHDEKRVLLSFKKGKTIVSDTGPGVEPEDAEQIFSLFFTRRTYEGRGVGLYLCRANLATGGHKIRYASTSDEEVLSGANFVIEFEDLENDGHA